MATLDNVEQAFYFPPGLSYPDVTHDAIGQAMADKEFFLRLIDEARRRGAAGEMNGREILDWMYKKVEGV